MTARGPQLTTRVMQRRSAREQILDAAYELFTQRGVRGVGVDEVIARSGVAKATLYKHFRSKNELAIAFLDRREQQWAQEFIEAGLGAASRRSRGPAAGHLRHARPVVPAQRVVQGVLVHERAA